MRGPILVIGGYGYRNVGDEAILAGLLTTLGGQRVTVVSRAPAETTAMHGVPAVGVGQALDALRRHRTLLVGGGGLFGRDMGRMGRLLPAFGLLTRASGLRVVVHGVGVDAGMQGPNRVLVRSLLRVADAVSVRDEASARVLGEWGIDAEVTEDLSARMAPTPARIGRSLLRASGLDGREPVIGLCLTAVDEGMGRAAAAAVTDLAAGHPGLQLCFIPMSQHPFVGHHNDLLLARSLQAAVPRLKVVEGSHHPAAILSLFGTLDAVIAMRYHAYLFADRAKVPLVPITYADKCAAWLEERGMLAAEPTADALARALDALLPAERRAS